VAWLPQADLEPAGLPETTHASDTHIAHAMRIDSPFGRATVAMMTVAADRDSKQITVSLLLDGADI
jgi:hypothetical protein